MGYYRFSWRVLFLFSLLPFLSAMVTGCSGGSAVDQTRPPSTPILGSSPIVPFTRTPTAAPSITRTITLTPSPFPSKTITPTPLATFNPTEVSEIVDQLFFGDANNILSVGPIEPGISTWSQTQRYLNRFAVFSELYSCCSISAGIITPPERIIHSEHPQQFDIYFYMEKEVKPSSPVDYIALRQFNLLISDVLKRYGPPTHIYVFVLDTLPIDTYADYDLLLIYEMQGFMVSFKGKTGTGQMVSLCPDVKEIPLEGKRIVLYMPGKQISLEDIQTHEFLIRFFEKPQPGFLPLEEVSEMSIEQFTEFFSTPGNLCITIDNPTKPQLK